jgi:predicted acetyltransferase
MSFRPLTPDEAEAAAARGAASFGAVDLPDDLVDIWTDRIERGEIWGLVDDTGTTVAHCRLTSVDHWFAGGRVTCQHVAAVAVPPEHRGQGHGGRLMRAALEEGLRRGAGLSLLFPATTPLYRSLGYEHAGHFARYRLDARLAPAVGAPLRLAGPEDWPAIRACHRRYTRSCNGPQSDRTEEAWADRREARFAYVQDGPLGDVEGYVLVDHTAIDGDWRYRLTLVDWAATTPRALASVVGFVGRHGSTAADAVLRGPVPEPWSLLAAEQDVELRSDFFWMARGLNLAAALATRGYNTALRGSVVLAVDDPVLPPPVGTDARAYRLTVAGGVAEVLPADAEDVQVHLHARAVGPLFTGFRSAGELAGAGLAEGDEDALDWLSCAFASSPPFLLDFF